MTNTNGYSGSVRRSPRALITWCLPMGVAAAALCGSVSARTITIGGEGGADWGEGCSTTETCITPVFIAGPKESGSGNTPGGVIDFSSREGWISPEEADVSENIARDIYKRGGTITAPTVNDNLDGELPKLVDGDDSAEKTFKRKDTPGRTVSTLGVTLQFDLGSQFGVSRFVFYPSVDFPDDYMRAFEIFLNDGSENTSTPLFGRGVFLELQNDQPTVEVIIEPQLVRYIQLTSHTTVDFEIAEFEVYGAGFVPVAQYLTDIFDFGEELALWGNIRWTEESLGDSLRARSAIRTRSGLDDTPVVYHRLREGDDGEVPWKEAEKFDEETREWEIVTELDSTDLRSALIAYNELSLEERNLVAITEKEHPKYKGRAGRVRDDVTNWSLWSPPHSPEGRVTSGQFEAGEGGTKVLSPAPRRYFQARIDFENDDLFSAQSVGGLSFDVSDTSLAQQIVAEITPRDTNLGELTEFTYTIIPDMRPGIDRGFSAVEISTPVRAASIGQITYRSADGSVDLSQDFSDVDNFTALPEKRGQLTLDLVEEKRFLVRFPKITSSSIEDGEMAVITVAFTSPVLRAATAFSGRVLPDAPQGGEVGGLTQELSGGNAADLREAGSGLLQANPANLVVQVPIEGSLLINVGTSSPLISPNGDTVNDTATLNYDITSLIGGAKVRAVIYDLAGRLVKEVYAGNDPSGRYSRPWDGTGADQKRVPPGTYIYSISLETDTGDEQTSGTIAVAY